MQEDLPTKIVLYLSYFLEKVLYLTYRANQNESLTMVHSNPHLLSSILSIAAKITSRRLCTRLHHCLTKQGWWLALVVGGRL